MGTPAPPEGPPYDPGVPATCWVLGRPWDEWSVPKVIRCIFTGMQTCPAGDPTVPGPPNGRVFYLDQLPLSPNTYEYTNDPAVGDWFFVQWISYFQIPLIPPPGFIEASFLALSGGKKGGGPNSYFNHTIHSPCHTAFKNQAGCGPPTAIAFAGSGRIY